jgi:DNA-binding IclR family transcriptional regulator
MSLPPDENARRSRGSSPSNRSLERGVEILRAFRPGSELLGNGELAERTGLPKSTVSRLTQTLVAVGMLQAESALRAYRLAPAVLSLGHAMRTGSRVLSIAAQRIPMELTSLGRAYLAVAPDAACAALMESFRRRRPAQWSGLRAQILEAARQVRADGYCSASWQPEIVALASPLVTPDAIYVLNLSLSTTEPIESVADRLAPKLLTLRGQVLAALE